MADYKNDFFNAIETSLSDKSFVKMSLGNYHGEDPDLKSMLIKLILIKNEQKLSFTYRYKTKDIIKNYTFEEAKINLKNICGSTGFRIGNLFTLAFDLQFEVINQTLKLKKKEASHKTMPSLQHDKQKNRKIEAAGKLYLQELKITDKAGVVYQNAQDKFKQINHYVEILSSLLDELSEKEVLNVVDMGAGKGYLTFALYDYLKNTLNRNTNIVGVEYRADLVTLCNKIAQNAHFESLQFVEGTIEAYQNKEIDVLIALHACDTATDDAIQKGIENNAELIVVAPCCHKQIRREIERNRTKNDLDFLIKYGIFLERQAEMVTDGIRALILEYFGYSTKVFEFISDAHTPKNVLIVGQKKQKSQTDKAIILQKIQATKTYFGIDYHYLEKIMNEAV